MTYINSVWNRLLPIHQCWYSQMVMVVHSVTSSDGFYISMSLQDWTSWCNLMVSSSVTEEVDYLNFNFSWKLITSWILRTYSGHYIRKVKEGRRSEVNDGLLLYIILRHLKMLMVCNINHMGLTTIQNMQCGWMQILFVWVHFFIRCGYKWTTCIWPLLKTFNIVDCESHLLDHFFIQSSWSWIKWDQHDSWLTN